MTEALIKKPFGAPDRLFSSFRFFAWRGGLLAVAVFGIGVAIRSGAATFAGDAISALTSDYHVKTWQTGDGLPESSATAIVQTDDGYIWFGTFNGLVRFDGATFTVRDPSNTPELPSEGIVNLHLDAAGQLWVSTLRGLAVMHNGQWKTLSRAAVSQSNFARTISDGGGVVCVTTYDGQVLQSETLNPSTSLKTLPEPPGTKGHGYYGFVGDDGKIWVSQQMFFGYWGGQAWLHSPIESVVTNQFHGMGPGRDGRMIVVAGSKLLRTDGTDIFKSMDLPRDPGDMWQVYEDTHGTIWLCTQAQGIYQVESGGSIHHYDRDLGLPTSSIRCAWRDREDNVWLGTSGDGLIKLTQRRFRLVDLAALYPSKRITALFDEGGGQVLLGSYGKGLARASAESTNVTPINLFPDGGDPHYVQSVMRDHSGNVWVGAYHHKLCVVPPNGQTRLIAEEESGGVDIAAIFEDSRNRVWIGGNNAIAVYENDRFRTFPASAALPLGNIKSFAEDLTAGVIWAASADGVFQFDENNWTELKSPAGQSLKESNTIRAEPNGAIWIGGSTVPLRRYFKGDLKSVTQTNGLPTGTIASILDDGRGYWWMGSNRGVVRVAKAELDEVADGHQAVLAAQLFTVSDGLPSVECVSGFQATAIKDDSGRLWFATLKGVVTIDPATVAFNTVPPPVYIDGFRIESRKGRQSFLATIGSDPVRVPPGQMELAVFYSALSFAAPEKIQFAYRIEGLRDEWTRIDDRRSIYMFPPPPGTYRVWVKASNNDGVWNETGASVAFQVMPFIWQTWWFRTGALALMLGGTGFGAWWLARSRVRQRLAFLEEQSRIEKERLRLVGVLEATSDLVAFADRNRKVLFINPAGRQMLGLDQDENVEGRAIAEFHSQTAADQIVNEAIPHAMKVGNWSGESVLLRRDGREVHVSQVVLIHKSPEGEVEWYSTIARDITERKRVEEALRKSEEKFARSFRSSPVPMAISNLESGALIEVNEAMERFTGYQRKEVIGRTAIDTGFWSNENERQRLVETLQETGFVRGRELDMTNRNGQRIVMQYSAELIEMSGEKCILTVLADITQRKLMEDALQASERLLRQFIKHAPAAVAMFDRNMCYLQVSERWISDYHLEGKEIIGRSHYDVFPDIPERWKVQHRKALAGETLRAEEDPFERANGSVEWLQWDIQPWRTASGEIGGIIMFTQVITERKLASQKMRDQMAELQRWHNLTLDREDRVLQLKTEVNELTRRFGGGIRYPSASRTEVDASDASSVETAESKPR
ncbi:PAS domain S-box protein [bacterium]|nr:PAS domain S-box protein [bacterium]